ARVVTHILGGGGMTSRLMEEVREKRGLAYGVGAGMAAWDTAGLVYGRVATRNDRIAESLEIIRREWRRMAEEGPTEQELADAKAYLKGSFP
ncbi:M16 family metallopeptidase, partial [Acinetobacter johnsonii]|uniref:M16 family metallopeptidase n=1 Tax=Acinetobacter johnsonii TaxID=40214 RepID=UPI001F42CFAC